MESNDSNGSAEQPASDAALEAHVTAIMDAVAVADDPTALRNAVRGQLVTLAGGLLGANRQDSFDGLQATIKSLLLNHLVDHFNTGAGPQPTAALTTVRRVAALVRCADKLDDLSYCGAALADVFLDRPWLQAFDVEVRAEWRMGDEGGFFTSYNVSADNLVALSEGEVPEDLQEDDGELDTAMALGDIDSELETDAPALAGAVGLTDRDDEAVKFTVNRSALQDLFDVAASTATPVSGIAVAQRIWPERMASVVRDLGECPTSIDQDAHAAAGPESAS